MHCSVAFPGPQIMKGVKEMAKHRGNNQGSIWKRGDKFRAAISLNGKRISKSFDSRTVAQSWLNEKLTQKEKGFLNLSSTITIKDYLDDWLDIHGTRLKPKSIIRYKQVARDYIFPYIGNKKLRDLTIFDVEGLYQKLLKQGISHRNVRYVHSLLHRSLKDAALRGLIHHNPAHGARQPKLVQKEMQILDENQVTQFLLAAKGHRHGALFNLAIKTGMRQGELLGLRWADIDWLSSYIRVQRQVQRVTGQGMVFSSPKTKAGRRTIPLGGETLKLLMEQQHRIEEQKMITGSRWKEHNLVFASQVGTPLSSSNLLKEFKALLEEADLLQIRFHDLRHTAASIMLNRGIPPYNVSRILGHSKPSTTLDYYGHLVPMSQDDIGNKMDNWLTPIPVDMGFSVEKPF